jgi:hypothetical protein
MAVIHPVDAARRYQLGGNVCTGHRRAICFAQDRDHLFF